MDFPFLYENFVKTRIFVHFYRFIMGSVFVVARVLNVPNFPFIVERILHRPSTFRHSNRFIVEG